MSEKIKIMLIDDEEDIREVLGISLSDMGYKVLTAGNGNDALELILNEKPQIILTDIKMPNMDGIEILRKTKQINPDTEVIMMTGHGDMDLAIRSLKNEATDFITKPINDEVLELALRKSREKIITRQQLRDYTERLENLLREKSELQDRLSSLGIMIGSISHGIKGYLTRLDGGIYLVNSALAKEKYGEVPEGMEIVKQTTERIKKMVLDILYYAKERELKIEKVNALDFARDVADVIEQKINGRNIEFVHDFNREPIEIEIDSEFLHSALLNILDNAVDACTADPARKYHKITFGIKQDKKNVIFDVYDNGTGMNSETKENIFNLFFSSKGSKGTGFGLFISDNIIKQHMGLINVNSAKGKGTHFNIKIPKLYADYKEKEVWHDRKKNTNH